MILDPHTLHQTLLELAKLAHEHTEKHPHPPHELLDTHPPIKHDA